MEDTVNKSWWAHVYGVKCVYGCFGKSNKMKHFHRATIKLMNNENTMNIL